MRTEAVVEGAIIRQAARTFRIAALLIVAGLAGVAHAATQTDAQLISWVQCRLTQLGLDPGTIDGRLGKRTHDAIKQVMGENSSGEITRGVVERLRAGTAVEYLPEVGSSKAGAGNLPPPLARCSGRVGFEKGTWRCLAEAQCETFNGPWICGPYAKSVTMVVVRASSSCGGDPGSLAKLAPESTARTLSPLASLSLARLRALIGNSPASEAATALLGPLASDRTVSTFTDAVYHSYKHHGLSVVIENNTIAGIFLYAQGADGFDAYPGELPLGLSWADVRRDVERKLGAPTATGGDGAIPFWARHQHGVSVSYRDKSTTDFDNPLHHLTLRGCAGVEGTPDCNIE